MLYHTGIFAIDTPDEAASVIYGAGSYVIEGGLVTGSSEEIRQAVSEFRKTRPRTFGSTYEAADRIRIHNEIRIIAGDLEQAFAAARTLVAGIAVSDGYSWLLPDDGIDVKESDGAEAPLLICRQMQRPVQLAAAVSADEALHYAVHRLALSYRSASIHYVDLDPIESPRRFTSSIDPYVHVRLANAISLAYSAIEQLDLGVKASREKPSRMPNGSWNTAVREDLERRLRSRKIDAIEPQLWTLRGPPTPIELKKSPPPSISPSRWRNPEVRDRELDLLDCISLAGWHRNNVGFHGLSSELAPHLTIYDAFNVQHVARRLIMASVGLW